MDTKIAMAIPVDGDFENIPVADIVRDHWNQAETFVCAACCTMLSLAVVYMMYRWNPPYY